jgi:hypothetical protein
VQSQSYFFAHYGSRYTPYRTVLATRREDIRTAHSHYPLVQISTLWQSVAGGRCLLGREPPNDGLVLVALAGGGATGGGAEAVGCIKRDIDP